MEIAAAGANFVLAAAPVSQDGAEVPAKDGRPQGKPRGQVQEPVKHPEKVEVRKPGDQPAKVPAKTLEGKVQGTRPQGAEQRGHVPPAIAVLPPPVVPPPPELPKTDPAEPAAKIPRFAALKTDETNMRRGPGQRYPIDWVYQRHDLPVEVEREYDVWRYVRDPDGVQGWVHQVTLSDRRTFMIKDKDATLRTASNDTASAVAVLKAGVIGRLKECDAGSKWCEVQVSGYKGYLRRDQIWGLLQDEVLAPS